MEQDKEKAVKWILKSAEQGYAEAQFYLGVIYYKGDGVKRDAVEAVKWFRKAAEQGDTGAREMLASFGIKVQ